MKRLWIAVTVMAVAACGGMPASRPAPDWISSPPQPDATYFYFTGAGSSATGDQAQAEQTARGAMTDDIMRYIGVKVTSETTATAKASVDSFKSDVLQTVTQTGSGRIAGLQITDTYVEKRNGAVTVYLLATFEKTTLDAEKSRIEALFVEQQQAVSGPEADGKSLEAAGDYYAASVKYMEAAVAAATSGVDNARIKFQRTINEAKDALDHVAVVKLNDNLSTAVGTPFADPFRAKVVAGSVASDPGIGEVSLIVSYATGSGSRRQVTRATIKTDRNGVAAFTYPIPDFVGTDKLTMTLDLEASVAAMDALPKDYAQDVGGLEDVAAAKRVTFALSVFSSARGIDTGMAVAAIDSAGRPISSADFSSGVLKSLSAAGFAVRTLALDASAIVGGKDADIMAAAATAGNPSRVMYGTAQIIGTETDSGSVVANVTATVSVADLATGATLLTVTKNKSAVGSTQAAAIAAALQQLGQDIGQEIANRLR